MSSPYSFPGVAPFIAKAADARNFSDLRLVHKAKGLEHVARVQSSLGQACQAHERDRAEIVNNALGWRDSLVIALAGIDAAIGEVFSALGLDPPPFAAPKPHNPVKRPGRKGE